jgi:hypothetical protein
MTPTQPPASTTHAAPSTSERRRTPRRVAAAAAGTFLLAGAALALAACDSGPSTPPADAKSPVVAKQAGLFAKDVHVEVVNQTTTIVTLDMCTALIYADSCTTWDMPAGSAAEFTAGTVQGHLHIPGGGVIFKADNPAVGEPYWVTDDDYDAFPDDLATARDRGAADMPFTEASYFYMVEGEVQKTTVLGHDVQVERRGDTDYKEMRLLLLN